MEPQSNRAIEVFFSYSHKDEELRDQLENHLSMLKRKGIIKGWHDRRILGGQEWDRKIDEHLNSADIILLLVSPDFLASDYCYDIEVTRAMERHDAKAARVIPIILRTSDWKDTPFSKVQAFPKDAKPVTKWDDRDDAFQSIAQGIREVAAEIKAKEQAGASSATQEAQPTPLVYIPDILRVPFVARKDIDGDDIVERLKAELAPHQKRLVVLWGAGGVGKTAIATEVARALIDAFNQRVVWVSAEGREDFSLTSLLDGIATQLKQDELRKLALEPKKEQVREALMSAPTLVVLDNFETITETEANLCAEWLAQPALCSALVTTRQIIETARNIPVEPMHSEEAHDLLRRLIKQVHDRRAFANLDQDRVIRIAEANPLVLQWIVGQIDLAQDPEEVLDELAHGEGKAAVRVFDRSFNLPQLATGGRAALLALSLFIPSATRTALAEVAGMGKDKDKKRFKEARKNLSALWLIRTTEDQRLAVEGLTRELTKARLSKDPSRSKTFRQRFVSRFTHYAGTHQQPTVANLNILEAEKDNLIAAMDIAFNSDDWKSVIRLMSIISYGAYGLLTLRGYWDEAIKKGEQTLEAARRLRDERYISMFAHNVAVTYQNRGQLEKARWLYNESLEIIKRLGDQRDIAAVLHQLGSLAQAGGDYNEARRLYNESLEIDKKFGNQSDTAASLGSLGILAQDQGDYNEARRLYNESLEINKKLGDQRGIAASLHQLGILAQDQGDYNEARRLYNESLKINKKLGDQRGIAASLHQLGTVSLDDKDFETAEKLLNESLAILNKLGHKAYIAACLESIGKLKVKQGRYAEAQALLSDSLKIAEAVGVPLRIGSVKHSLGLLAEKQGDVAGAASLFREALDIFERIGSVKKEKAREDLERLEKESS